MTFELSGKEARLVIHLLGGSMMSLLRRTRTAESQDATLAISGVVVQLQQQLPASSVLLTLANPEALLVLRLLRAERELLAELRDREDSRVDMLSGIVERLLQELPQDARTRCEQTERPS